MEKNEGSERNAKVSGQKQDELTVHIAQANNNSPYTFVRAKFEPGEVSDPWAVRFFDGKGVEVDYFVWDFVTWKVAREGRADWGNRYALLNHACGNSAEALQARSRKLEWAKRNSPELCFAKLYQGNLTFVKKRESPWPFFVLLVTVPQERRWTAALPGRRKEVDLPACPGVP